MSPIIMGVIFFLIFTPIAIMIFFLDVTNCVYELKREELTGKSAKLKIKLNTLRINSNLGINNGFFKRAVDVSTCS